MTKMIKNQILGSGQGQGQGQGQGHGQGHIECKIFSPFQILQKKQGFVFKKSNLTSFYFKGHGQGHHRIAREKSNNFFIKHIS